jgi:hypothetical protein
MSSVQELPMIIPFNFPKDIPAAFFATIQNSLKRNQQLNRDALLLAPPPPPLLQRQQQRQQQQTTSSMMLKLSHKAISEFVKVGIDNHAGASAIFKLIQVRPALLEKRIKRRPPDASIAASSSSIDSSNDSNRRRIREC